MSQSTGSRTRTQLYSSTGSQSTAVHTRIPAHGDRCLRGKYDSHATMQPMGDQTSEQEDGGDSHGHHGHGHPRHPAAIAAANLGEELLCAGKSARRWRPAASVRACSLALSSSSSASLLPLCALPLGCRSQVVSLAGQLLLPDGSGLAGGCSR